MGPEVDSWNLGAKSLTRPSTPRLISDLLNAVSKGAGEWRHSKFHFSGFVVVPPSHLLEVCGISRLTIHLVTLFHRRIQCYHDIEKDLLGNLKEVPKAQGDQ